MTSPIGGSLGDGAEARMNEFSDELGNELSDASRHVRRSFERAGASLDVGAEKLKDGIRQTGDSVKGAGRRVSEVVSSSSQYLRSNGLRDVIDDVEGLVKEHPGKALLAVAALGFLLGRTLTSKD